MKRAKKYYLFDIYTCYIGKTKPKCESIKLIITDSAIIITHSIYNGKKGAMYNYFKYNRKEEEQAHKHYQLLKKKLKREETSSIVTL